MADLPDELRQRTAANIEDMRSDEESDWMRRMLTVMARKFPAGTLSPAEKDVLQMIAFGLEIPHIAELLQKQPMTVKQQLKNAQLKLMAKNRAHAIAIALRNDLIV
jgi:DNA-binding CsgD family transcriptional regulator